MQFEVIRKSHKKEVVIGVVAIILIAVVLLVRASFAKYLTVKSFKIAEGTINYTVPDFKIMAMYKNDGEGDIPIDTMPESGYKINIEKSYCTIDNINKVYNKMYTDESGNHVITGLSKDSKCYIYFDKESNKASDTIIGDKTIPTSSDTFTTTATTDEGIFKAQDNDGDTYYFRGAVENNYVKFADKYWRIIRINGDGTIRMIYDGDAARANGSKLTVEEIKFNSPNNNAYVGFKYVLNDVHGHSTADDANAESTILKKLYTWYENNLQSYESDIDPNAGFCNDRRPSTSKTTSNGEGGIGDTATYYGAYIRLYTNKSQQTPTFGCKYESDLFTKSGAVKKDGTENGNRSLKYPIGLITADEAVYAGGLAETANSSYYLFTDQVYWTLSPYWYYSGYAYVFIVNADGRISGSNVNFESGIRPVINLKADTTFTYNNESTKGTMNDPYVVE